VLVAPELLDDDDLFCAKAPLLACRASIPTAMTATRTALFIKLLTVSVRVEGPGGERRDHIAHSVAGNFEIRGQAMASHLRIIGAFDELISCQPVGAAARETLSDEQVRQAIIQDRIARCRATGHPCACPYNLARNGSRCGGRSAYS
jgi:hypothetical protein